MTPNEYGVRGIPTMLLFRDGKLLDQKVGAMPKNALKGWIADKLGELTAHPMPEEVGAPAGFRTWLPLIAHDRVRYVGDRVAFVIAETQMQARDAADRDAFLTALGACLVFLIDWNKARKLLRNWVTKDDAVRILGWAARHRIGHRAFLELLRKRLPPDPRDKALLEELSRQKKLNASVL